VYRRIIMYSMIIRSKIRRAFKQLNERDFASIVAQFSPDAEHIFYGNSALGGSRYTPAGIRSWYNRLAEVFPSLRFDLKKITVNGWPWDTAVAAEWIDYIVAKDGARFSNQGVHAFRIRWGKVTSLHVYCDTEKLDRVLAHQVAQGISAAEAPPIVDEMKRRSQV
jgi:ketosteroid isomerase-like protein